MQIINHANAKDPLDWPSTKCLLSYITIYTNQGVLNAVKTQTILYVGRIFLLFASDVNSGLKGVEAQR